MRTSTERQEVIKTLNNLNPDRHEPVFIHVKGIKFVLLREDEYQKISQSKEQNLTEFFKNSPLSGIELDIERDKTTSREVEF